MFRRAEPVPLISAAPSIATRAPNCGFPRYANAAAVHRDKIPVKISPQPPPSGTCPCPFHPHMSHPLEQCRFLQSRLASATPDQVTSLVTIFGLPKKMKLGTRVGSPTVCNPNYPAIHTVARPTRYSSIILDSGATNTFIRESDSHHTRNFTRSQTPLKSPSPMAPHLHQQPRPR